MPPKHYIFNHIPKTGGISLLAVCRDNLEAAEISPNLRDAEIRLIPAARFEHYKLITGHFSVLTQTGFCCSRYSMTLLRDPIRRIFSAYTFWRTEAEQNPVTAKAKELSFAEFVRYFVHSPAVIHNPYTYHFAAIGRDCPGHFDHAAALLAAARHNLAAFDFVGICEEMGRSIRLLCHELGWRAPVVIPHENRTSSEAWFGEIDPQTMEILKDRNGLDLELYKYAAQILQAREDAAASKLNAGFQRPGEPNRFVPFPAPYKMERRAIIRSVSAMWIPEESSRILEFAVEFTITAPVAELSLGLQVNDATGAVVWGTSTAHATVDLDYEVGRESRATFLVECELPPGKYLATAALSEPPRLGFHEHWIDHATLFTVAPPWVARSRYKRGMRLREFSSVVIRDTDGV